ncbi:MAG: hypothetical protein ACXW5U_16390 [Thermoanaerobaculia bacterium]
MNFRAAKLMFGTAELMFTRLLLIFAPLERGIGGSAENPVFSRQILLQPSWRLVRTSKIFRQTRCAQLDSDNFCHQRAPFCFDRAKFSSNRVKISSGMLEMAAFTES